MLRKLDIWSTYRLPLLLGVLSLAGLVTALLGDAVWDWTSWVLLGLPFMIACYHLGKPSQR